MNQSSRKFIPGFQDMQASVHATAVSKGWWKQRQNLELFAKDGGESVRQFAETSNQLSALMLAITELAEGAEGLRIGNPPDDKIPEFSSIEAECADAIIRLMDLAEAYGWRLAEAIAAKAEMNQGRPHMHGGKIA